VPFDEHPIRAHEDEFKRINARLTKAEELIDRIRTDGQTRLLTMEHVVTDYGLRLDKEEKQTEAMLEIAHAVRRMSETVDKVAKRQDAHEECLITMRGQTGNIAIKGWIFVASIAGSAVVMGIIGLIVGWMQTGR
jgi:hypothetical protein